jgi:hypothetical protein
MRVGFVFILFIRLWKFGSSNNSDRFNYQKTTGTDYGPEDWSRVTCSDIGECLGWPDGWKSGVGWELERNKCNWCPATGNKCGLHRQSPIDLLRVSFFFLRIWLRCSITDMLIVLFCRVHLTQGTIRNVMIIIGW